MQSLDGSGRRLVDAHFSNNPKYEECFSHTRILIVLNNKTPLFSLCDPLLPTINVGQGFRSDARSWLHHAQKTFYLDNIHLENCISVVECSRVH